MSSGQGTYCGMSEVRMFRSDFMERFSHTHPMVPLGLWLPVSLVLLWLSREHAGLGWSRIGTAAIGGFLLWGPSEYLLHRKVFHFHAVGRAQERLAFIIHGVHHLDPRDRTRLVMPPLPAGIIAAVLFSIMRVICGPVWVLPIFSGFLIGYLRYDYTHYALHHFQMRSRIGTFFKKHHMYHHFYDWRSNWGVSTPLWDFVFGTARKIQPGQKPQQMPVIGLPE